ncbi:Na+/H+ antiporter NhaA [Jatrophihabitans sp. YIM 134969]
MTSPEREVPVTTPGAGRLQGTTRWTRQVAAPVAQFLRTESGSAVVLVAAIVAALVWANLPGDSYERWWELDVSLRLGDVGVTRDLRTWVNSGLMTFFFLVVGLEARREFDLGDLRERRRFLLPLFAGVLAMALPVLLYLAFTLGGPGARGWGVAMSTDTALALGLLTLVGRQVPDRVRVFLVTIFVVDDVASLLVVTVVYSEHVEWMPLALAVLFFGFALVVKYLGVRRGWVYFAFSLVSWFALLGSGVDPIILGLAVGLIAVAYSPSRDDLEQVSGLYRLFREQPTPQLARSARTGLVRSISPNARLLDLYLPWSSYLIVPLFGLANAGLVIDGPFLARAMASPVVWGVVVGYVVGKPVAVIATSWALERATSGRVRPQVGWASVLGSGTIAGIGFTVSFVVAALVFDGDRLAEAKFGVLLAALIASLVTWVVFRVTALLPGARRERALLGDGDQIVDLAQPVDPDVDHVRGPADASVTVVEYGDFQCPYCGQAEPEVRRLLVDTDLRYVWRHLPLTDVHPQAHMAALAAEAAAAQGKFWEMHDLMLDRQEHLRIADLLDDARELGLDTDRFHDDVMNGSGVARVARDVESADESGVAGTPTFFVNGVRHFGAYDVETLKQAVRTARIRASIAGRGPAAGESTSAGDSPAAGESPSTGESTVDA